MDANKIGDNIVRGFLGTAIGTDIALGTLLGFDQEGKRLNEGKWKDYKGLFISIPTLFRNLYGSAGDRKEKITTGGYASMVVNEMHLIENMVQMYTDSQLKVFFYNPSYIGLDSLLPDAKLKIASSGKQKLQEELKKGALSFVANEFGSSDNYVPVGTSLTIPFEKSLILTSFVVDIVGAVTLRYGSTVDLIESHTGAIKDKTLWYTKLNKAANIERFPLTAGTLTVFGDGKMVAPLSKKIRDELGELAVSRKWHQLTSPAIINSEVAKLIKKHA